MAFRPDDRHGQAYKPIRDKHASMRAGPRSQAARWPHKRSPAEEELESPPFWAFLHGSIWDLREGAS
jgi:hypothetical protein